MIKADIEHIRLAVDNLMPQSGGNQPIVMPVPNCDAGSKRALPPCIHQMARPPAWRHQHHVEADRQAGEGRVPGDEGRGGALQPLALAKGKGGARRIQRAPRLDFDDGDGTAPLCYDVDLPLPAAPAARQDTVALQP